MPHSVISGNFNNDHQLDFAIANYGTSNVGVFLAGGNRTFLKQKIYSTGIHSQSYSITVGHFNGDNLFPALAKSVG